MSVYTGYERLKTLLSFWEGYIIKNVMPFICYALKKRKYILGDAVGKRTPDVPSSSSDTNLNIELMCVQLMFFRGLVLISIIIRGGTSVEEGR